jgi:hypothetical protein
MLLLEFCETDHGPAAEGTRRDVELEAQRTMDVEGNARGQVTSIVPPGRSRDASHRASCVVSMQ